MNGVYNQQPFHLLAYYTAGLAIGATNVALGSVVDQAVTRNATGYFFPDDMKIYAAYVGIPNGTAARVNSPSQRDPFLPYLFPISLTALPDNIPPVYLPRDRGPTAYNNEYLTIEASRGGAAIGDSYTLLWLTKGLQPVPPGPVRAERFTATLTGAAGVWTIGNIAFADQLPNATYAIVGGAFFDTNMLAGRLVFNGGNYRPGTLAQGAQGEWTTPAFTQFEFGLWGKFWSQTPPQFEGFHVGAGSGTVTGYLDLIRM